jgi:hypothetical protein
MEILDVFKNIHSQVAERQMKQVAVFPDSVLPKTQRDLGVEVNVDKGIESMNRLLESKLGSLEYFVQNISEENRGARGALERKDLILPYTQAYAQVTGTGDLTPLWNGIVRGYQTKGLSKQSQEIIKVKMQELKGNLDAMKYGLSSGVQVIFEKKIIDAQIALKILELLRALSVYTLISLQADSGILELINTERLESAYKNVLQSLSLEQIHILQRFSKAGSVMESPIRNIPLFGTESGEARLKEVADELGFDVPSQLLSNLVRLPASDFDLAVTKLKNEAASAKSSVGLTGKETEILRELGELTDNIMSNRAEIELLESEKEALEQHLELLDGDPVVEEVEVLPEVPEPELPDVSLLWEDEGAYDAAEEAYSTALREYRAYRESQLQAVLARRNAIAKRLERTSARRQCERELARKNQEIEQISNDIEADEIIANSYRYELNELKGEVSAKALRAMKLVLDASSGKELKLHKTTRSRMMQRMEEERKYEDSEEEEEEVGEGRGKDIGTRGLSTMRANYGVRGHPSRLKGAMHFDDTRNDSFCSRPY